MVVAAKTTKPRSQSPTEQPKNMFKSSSGWILALGPWDESWVSLIVAVGHPPSTPRSMGGGTHNTPNDALCPECRTPKVKAALNIPLQGPADYAHLTGSRTRPVRSRASASRCPVKGHLQVLNLQIPVLEFTQGPHPQQSKSSQPGQQPCSD